MQSTDTCSFIFKGKQEEHSIRAGKKTHLDARVNGSDVVAAVFALFFLLHLALSLSAGNQPRKELRDIRFKVEDKAKVARFSSPFSIPTAHRTTMQPLSLSLLAIGRSWPSSCRQPRSSKHRERERQRQRVASNGIRTVGEFRVS